MASLTCIRKICQLLIIAVATTTAFAMSVHQETKLDRNTARQISQTHVEVGKPTINQSTSTVDQSGNVIYGRDFVQDIHNFNEIITTMTNIRSRIAIPFKSMQNVGLELPYALEVGPMDLALLPPGYCYGCGATSEPSFLIDGTPSPFNNQMVELDVEQLIVICGVIDEQHGPDYPFYKICPKVADMLKVFLVELGTHGSRLAVPKGRLEHATFLRAEQLGGRYSCVPSGSATTCLLKTMDSSGFWTPASTTIDVASPTAPSLSSFLVSIYRPSATTTSGVTDKTAISDSTSTMVPPTNKAITEVNGLGAGSSTTTRLVSQTVHPRSTTTATSWNKLLSTLVTIVRSTMNSSDSLRSTTSTQARASTIATTLEASRSTDTIVLGTNLTSCITSQNCVGEQMSSLSRFESLEVPPRVSASIIAAQISVRSEMNSIRAARSSLAQQELSLASRESSAAKVAQSIESIASQNSIIWPGAAGPASILASSTLKYVDSMITAEAGSETSSQGTKSRVTKKNDDLKHPAYTCMPGNTCLPKTQGVTMKIPTTVSMQPAEHQSVSEDEIDHLYLGAWRIQCDFKSPCVFTTTMDMKAMAVRYYPTATQIGSFITTNAVEQEYNDQSATGALSSHDDANDLLGSHNGCFPPSSRCPPFRREEPLEAARVVKTEVVVTFIEVE